MYMRSVVALNDITGNIVANIEEADLNLNMTHSFFFEMSTWLRKQYSPEMSTWLRKQNSPEIHRAMSPKRDMIVSD